MPRMKKVSFNIAEEELLVELVAKSPPLYNPDVEEYKMRTVRDEIWTNIGQKLNKPADRCRERWRRIRDNYRRAIKLRATKSGEAAEKIKQPKYSKILSTLKPLIELDIEPISSNHTESGDETGEFTSRSDPPTSSLLAAMTPPNLTDDSISREKLESPSQSFYLDPDAGIIASFKIEPEDQNDEFMSPFEHPSSSQTTNVTPNLARHSVMIHEMQTPSSSFDREFETETTPSIKIEPKDENEECIAQADPISSQMTNFTPIITRSSKRKKNKEVQTCSSPSAVNSSTVDDSYMRTKRDSVIDFFTNMGKTVSEFPEIFQIKVKREVFGIVSAAEEKVCLANAS